MSDGMRNVEKRIIEDIKKKLGVYSMKESPEDQKFMWFGHVVRMGDKRRIKNKRETRPSEKNGRGRARQQLNTCRSYFNRGKKIVANQRIGNRHLDVAKFCKNKI